jgi:hypothetical protein
MPQFVFQGNFCIYPIEDDLDELEEADEPDGTTQKIKQTALALIDGNNESGVPMLRLQKELPSNRPFEVKVIVYIVKVGYIINAI